MTSQEPFVNDLFLTGDTPLTGSVFYVLTLPEQLWYIQNVADAILALTKPENWQERGAVSAVDAAAAGSDVFMSFGGMLGMIFPHVRSTLPAGCLFCDGATYLRVDYPSLYAILDSNFKVDADHFVTPDLNHKVAIGADISFPVGTTGGQVDHVLTIAEMPTHSHVYGGTVSGAGVAPPPGLGAVTNPILASTLSDGGGNPHNNMQPYLALSYVVVAK